MKSVTDNVDLDIYAKYLWSHVSEDDGSISGSRVNFDAMDSNRLRGGARLSFKGSDVFSWYLGAATSASSTAGVHPTFTVTIRRPPHLRAIRLWWRQVSD